MLTAPSPAFLKLFDNDYWVFINERRAVRRPVGAEVQNGKHTR